MTSYKLISSPLGEVVAVAKDSILSIPFDPANTDYQEYLKWIEEGNTPLPPDTPETSE